MIYRSYNWSLMNFQFSMVSAILLQLTRAFYPPNIDSKKPAAVKECATSRLHVHVCRRTHSRGKTAIASCQQAAIKFCSS